MWREPRRRGRGLLRGSESDGKAEVARFKEEEVSYSLFLVVACGEGVCRQE
jgi:hypothetical protein